MALREFTDPEGTQWLAWDVPPGQNAVVRSGVDRRRTVTPGYAPERRVAPDRRKRITAPGLENGWVCFQSAGDKRRLYPPPTGWDGLAADELIRLCGQAEPVSPRL